MREARATSRERGSNNDIGSWMARRWAQLERRAAGRPLVGREAATRDGGGRPSTQRVRVAPDRAGALSAELTLRDLGEPILLSPQDLIESSPESDGAPEPMDLGLRFQAAGAGDSISRLVGSSDPAAIGKFLSLNGMDGRDSTLREGRSYVVPTRWDDATARERKVGQALLGADNARLRTLAEAQDAEARQAALLGRGSNASPVDLMTIWALPRTRVASPTQFEPRAWYDDSPTTMELARRGGWLLGVAPGMVRGGVNMAKGAVEGGYFLSRLANPTDALFSPPGESAAAQLVDAGLRAGSYIQRGVEDPSIVRDDLSAALRDFRTRHDLSASPAGRTMGGEFRRAFDVGMNNGELLFDVGSILAGGAFIRGAAGLGPLAKAPSAKELAHLAAHPGQAARFELPYKGMGHHIIERSARLPEWLGGRPYPEWVIESPFNKIREHDITTRDFYRNHNGAAGHFWGSRLPVKYGGGGWSAKDLGWAEYGPWDKLYYGTSPHTMTVAGPMMFGGPLVDAMDREERR